MPSPYEDAEYVLVERLQLSDATQIVLGISTFKGIPFGSFRKFVQSERYSGPTRAGFAISGDVLKLMIEHLTRLKGRIDDILRSPLPIECGRFKKSTQAELVIQVVAHERRPGESYVDVREFVTSQRFTGWTRKGIRFPVEALESMVEAAQKLSVALESGVPTAPRTYSSHPHEVKPTVPPQTTSPGNSTESTSDGRIGVPSKYSNFFT